MSTSSCNVEGIISFEMSELDGISIPTGISLDDDKLGNYASCMFERALNDKDDMDMAMNKVTESIFTNDTVKQIITPALSKIQNGVDALKQFLKYLSLGCMVYFAIILFIAFSVFLSTFMGSEITPGKDDTWMIRSTGVILIILFTGTVCLVYHRVKHLIDTTVHSMYCEMMKDIDVDRCKKAT